MGAISFALEWDIDKWAVIMTALAFIYNYVFRRRDTHLWAVALVVLLMYAIGHFLLAWINELPWDEQTYYRYSSRLLLYAIGIILTCAIGFLIGSNRALKIPLVIMSFVILLQLILHIDRNVIGFNHLGDFIETGNVINNFYPQDGYWALWDWYTLLVNLSTVILVLHFFSAFSALKRYSYLAGKSFLKHIAAIRNSTKR